jgi:hypothetical protein
MYASKIYVYVESQVIAHVVRPRIREFFLYVEVSKGDLKRVE